MHNGRHIVWHIENTTIRVFIVLSLIPIDPFFINTDVLISVVPSLSMDQSQNMSNLMQRDVFL